MNFTGWKCEYVIRKSGKKVYWIADCVDVRGERVSATPITKISAKFEKSPKKKKKIKTNSNSIQWISAGVWAVRVSVCCGSRVRLLVQNFFDISYTDFPQHSDYARQLNDSRRITTKSTITTTSYRIAIVNWIAIRYSDISIGQFESR